MVRLKEGCDLGPSGKWIPGVGLQSVVFPVAEEVGPSVLTLVQGDLLSANLILLKQWQSHNVGLYYTKLLLGMSLGKLNGIPVEIAYQVKCHSSLMKVLIIRCWMLVSYVLVIYLSVSLKGQRTTNIQIRKHIISLTFLSSLGLFNIVEWTTNSYILQ